MSTSESSFIRPDGTPARILVVDDESVLAELLGSALRHQGWETKTAANGWEALDKADTFDPDVVVLDIQMPGLDGMETLERLHKRKPHLPVLFLTARDAVADRVAGLRAGADDYVTKPFDLDEVTARIDALLRRSGMASITAERVLTVGDLTLDEALTMLRATVKQLRSPTLNSSCCATSWKTRMSSFQSRRFSTACGPTILAVRRISLSSTFRICVRRLTLGANP